MSEDSLTVGRDGGGGASVPPGERPAAQGSGIPRTSSSSGWSANVASTSISALEERSVASMQSEYATIMRSTLAMIQQAGAQGKEWLAALGEMERAMSHEFTNKWNRGETDLAGRKKACGAGTFLWLPRKLKIKEKSSRPIKYRKSRTRTSPAPELSLITSRVIPTLREVPASLESHVRLKETTPAPRQCNWRAIMGRTIPQTVTICRFMLPCFLHGVCRGKKTGWSTRGYTDKARSACRRRIQGC